LKELSFTIEYITTTKGKLFTVNAVAVCLINSTTNSTTLYLLDRSFKIW